MKRTLARIVCGVLGLGHYTSTACYHVEHESCRRHCKFCGDECACHCHGKKRNQKNWLPLISWGRNYTK